MRVLAVALLAATGLCAQNGQNAGLSHNLNGFSWRSIGPAATGGRISDIAVARPVAGRPAELYVGTASGGIFKSTNEGVSWFPVFDRTGGMMSIGALAVAPSSPAIVWAGSGEANNRQSSSWGDGVYRSADGGVTWQRAGLADTRHIGRIAIHPTDPNVVYVAAVGHLWGPNDERGVFKTVDGGATWKKVLYRDPNTGANDIAMDPRDPNLLYAAMYQRQRKAWGFNGGGPGSGIFRTTDGGTTWTELTNGLPAGDKGRIGLAISPIDHRTIYATVEAERGGIFRSADGGDTWDRLTVLNPRPMYYSKIIPDPRDPNRLYLLGSNRGLFISDDGGRAFRDVFSAVHGEDHALWIDPENPNRLIAGGDGGVSISFDRGASWLFRINLPIGQFYNISANNADPFLVCGGLQDNGSWCTPTASAVNHGLSFKDAFNVGGGDGMFASFEDDRTLIVTSQNGAAGRVDLDTMQRQTIAPVLPAERRPSGSAPYRWYWTTPIEIGHHHPNTIYTGAQQVFRSDDRGVTWKSISPDLTANIDRETLHMMGGPIPPRALSRHDGQVTYSALTVIAESPLDRNLLYTGADDGTLQRTRDGGQHWTNLTQNVEGLPAGLTISGIAPSKHTAGRVYLTVDGHFDDDYRPYVFVSENYGQTWRAIAGGLPNASVHRIREHPSNPNFLAVGTEMGLYASFDRGQSWARLGQDLPTVPVYDLLFQEKANALVAATHGRSIWVLDHIEALAKLGPETAARLYPVSPARQNHIYLGQFWFGSGEYFAANPPYGAVISYFLPKNVTGGVRLAIQDPGGKRMRFLMGPGLAGLNRACWDLRRENPMMETPLAGFSDCAWMPRAGGGPLVAPGKYSVTITADGVPPLKTEILVLPDARSRVTESERKAHETAITSAAALQQHLLPARQAAQAMARQARSGSDLARITGQINGAMAEASRVQNAIDAYEGPPTAAQLRELEWAWEDATGAVNALNRMIRDETPSMKPVALPKR
jgi:photosystem II stability/assembly factor-like uncharacterized protein